MSIRVLQLLGAAGIVVLLTSGCATAGPLQTESHTVPLGGAESARVAITMGGGALLVRGGAADLLGADFVYRHQSWKPQVEYSIAGSEGSLTIRQSPTLAIVPSGSLPARWDVRLNSDVPMSLSITLGGGGGDLELGDLNLSRLDLKFGAGGANISLDGDWEKDLEANISGGVGGVKLTLPSDVGVRVEAESGLGGVDASDFHQEGKAYTNAVYGRSNVTLNIRIEVGVGGVELNLTD
jgi:hypothetical protein